MKRNANILTTRCTLTALVLVALLVWGCAGQTTDSQPQTGLAAPTRPAGEEGMVSNVLATQDESGMRIVVRSDRILTFSTFLQSEPHTLQLYLPEIRFQPGLSVVVPQNDFIAAVDAINPVEDGQPARLDIALKHGAQYDVSRQDSNIIITFPIAGAIAVSTTSPDEKSSNKLASPPTALPERVASDQEHHTSDALIAIGTSPFENGIDVKLTANKALQNYKAFTIAEPARIVVDIFDLKDPNQIRKTLPVQSELVKRVRYFTHPDRLRLVVDTYPKFLNKFKTEPVSDGLLVRVGSDLEKSAISHNAPINSATDNSDVIELAAAASPQPSATGSEASKPLKKAASPKAERQAAPTIAASWINRVDFASEEKGKSSVIIGTTREVDYTVTNQTERLVVLELPNTKIAGNRQRPLITTHFESAVDRVTPIYKEGTTTSRILIELREAVSYTVDKADGVLTVRFEASKVPPKPYEEANPPAWKKSLAGYEEKDLPSVTPKAAATSAAASALPEIAQAQDNVFIGGMSKKTYTGEKISLDFYETDIKNVFRILREVSGKNYAIDKDVTGKVTLSLDKPVPWDQVLDLVLKMNQLGMVYEGEIIRIATLNTLKNEELQRQNQLEAMKKAQAAKQELEPVVKEFIPVNYANARSEVLPHIVLTPNRGSVTVDDRNNQIIMTDVAEKIELAKETVRKIDKVVPQVIIEGRIIEATDTFSREVGTQWGAEGGPTFTRGLLNGIIDEGVLNYDISATNPPTSTLGQIGINFSKLTGTPFEIVDARLQASESEGQVKIISSPKVMTMNKKEAIVKQGLDYPYNKLDEDGNTVTEFQEVALKLTVTPLVTPDDRISLKVKLENKEVGAIINNQTSFTSKEASTELLVSDGDTVVIGGIRKTRKELGESGVPGLKDVPVLGWLFKASVTQDTKEELIIFLTPRIVRLEQK